MQTIMRKSNWTETQVREALAHVGGIPTEAARYLSQTYGRPCARNTISTYLAKCEALRAFQAECLETALDVAESALMRRIEQGRHQCHPLLPGDQGQASRLHTAA
jgi:hypothetical protein